MIFMVHLIPYISVLSVFYSDPHFASKNPYAYLHFGILQDGRTYVDVLSKRPLPFFLSLSLTFISIYLPLSN